MNMRMKRKILPPGVEDGDHAGVRAKMLFVVGKITNHTPRCVKEYIIDYGRLEQAEFVEWFRQGEDYMKISCWKQLRFSGLYPPLPLYLLTLGTMAVTTGVITDANMAAGSA